MGRRWASPRRRTRAQVQLPGPLTCARRTGDPSNLRSSDGPQYCYVSHQARCGPGRRQRAARVSGRLQGREHRSQLDPRELRHSFVSLMSTSSVPVEGIARLAGHSSTRTAEVVYRRELRPVLTTGAEIMDTIFKRQTSEQATHNSWAPGDGDGAMWKNYRVASHHH